jgi:hypothetical protein
MYEERKSPGVKLIAIVAIVSSLIEGLLLVFGSLHI